MLQSKKDLKYWLLTTLPILYGSFYLLVCIYYYKERITYGDTGYYLFKIIQKEGFNIESGRAISILSQFLPILLIKIGASLRWVMVGYSVNFALIYLVSFFIVKYLFKSHYLAWGALLCTHLFLHFGFYYPTEMIFSSAVLVVIFGFLTYNERNYEHPINPILYFTIGTLLLLILSFIHPFYYIVAGAILFCLFLVDYNKNYLYFILISIVLLGIKITFFKSGYEAGKLSSIDFKTFNWHSINKSYLTFFWKQSFNERFWIAKYALYGFIIFLLWKRKWLLAVSIPLAYLSLFLIVYLSIPNGESLGYMECYVVAISVFPLIVILFYADKYWLQHKNTFTIIAFIFSIYGLFRIESEPIYKDRVNYLENIFAYGRTNNISKFFIEESTIKHDKILVGWALPYESLILSTVSGKTQTIYINNSTFKIDEINKPNLFFGVPWEKPIYDLSLNKKYFHLDTSQYVVINGMDF